MVCRCVVYCALLLLCASMARAGEVTLTPARDNTLFQNSTGSTSNGSGQYLFAGRTGQSDSASRRRGLVQFDIAGSIPAGATISEVTLTMYMSRTAGGSSGISLHRVLADWGEGTSDAPMEEGAGAPSAPGDATWLHTFFDTDTWATPGGDFASVFSARKIVAGVGSYTWLSTDMLIADVQSWLDQPSTDFGWILIGTEQFGLTTKRFDSREHPTPANWPTLSISYVPEPGTCCLFLAATLVPALGRRRRRILCAINT